MERTIVLLKPDALQRNLLGEIIARFEKKGLKIIGLKMMKLSDEVLADHYSHHRDKPFFGKLVNFMKSAPVIAIALEGLEAIEAVRLLCGPTSGRKADAGSIRGDFAMSSQQNIIHASDSPETAEKEIWRFFNKNEIFDYPKIDSSAIYAEEELEK
ncbi:MAG: nucleoside-diphosphate kinase [Patescibacteria group bacterium]